MWQGLILYCCWKGQGVHLRQRPGGDGAPELHQPQRRGRPEEHGQAHRHAGGQRRRAERLAQLGEHGLIRIIAKIQLILAVYWIKKLQVFLQLLFNDDIHYHPCCDKHREVFCMKLTLAAKEFLKEIEVRKYSPKTIRSYRNNLNLFLCYCAENGMEDTEKIATFV